MDTACTAAHFAPTGWLSTVHRLDGHSLSLKFVSTSYVGHHYVHFHLTLLAVSVNKGYSNCVSMCTVYIVHQALTSTTVDTVFQQGCVVENAFARGQGVQIQFEVQLTKGLLGTGGWRMLKTPPKSYKGKCLLAH